MFSAEGRNPAYNLFLRITKTLALKMPMHKHRVLAAKWINKIDTLIDVSELEKSKYLKLLSIAMQSKVLVGPFLQEPPKDDFAIMSIYNLKPADIKSMIVDYKHTQRFRPHPYFTEISGDFKEYLVYQEIPEFGSHFYYACSKEPITCWAKSKFTILPKGGLESGILIPPIPEISKTKEDHVLAYESYLKSLKKCKPPKKCKSNKNCKKARKCKSRSSNDASDGCKSSRKLKSNKKWVDSKCIDDSASDYVDYQLIGQSPFVVATPPPHKQGRRNGDELPKRISFYVGGDPQPFHYKLASDRCHKNTETKCTCLKEDRCC